MNNFEFEKQEDCLIEADITEDVIKSIRQSGLQNIKSEINNMQKYSHLDDLKLLINTSLTAETDEGAIDNVNQLKNLIGKYLYSVESFMELNNTVACLYEKLLTAAFCQMMKDDSANVFVNYLSKNKHYLVKEIKNLASKIVQYTKVINYNSNQSEKDKFNTLTHFLFSEMEKIEELSIFSLTQVGNSDNSLDIRAAWEIVLKTIEDIFITAEQISSLEGYSSDVNLLQ